MFNPQLRRGSKNTIFVASANCSDFYIIYVYMIDERLRYAEKDICYMNGSSQSSEVLFYYFVIVKVTTINASVKALYQIGVDNKV